MQITIADLVEVITYLTVTDKSKMEMKQYGKLYDRNYTHKKIPTHWSLLK